MAKTRTRARCAACGHAQPKWMGQCPGCGQWGTMAEEAVATGVDGRASRSGDVERALPLRDVPGDDDQRAVSGIGEFDRVLGGGLVPGSVTLVGGEPGAGKSTLLLQAADAYAASGQRVLYVSAEESPGQVRRRAERLGTLSEQLLLTAATDVSVIAGVAEAEQPHVVIVDSIQTVRDPGVTGASGGITQVRECAATLTALAKQRDIAILLVGHVTKEGQLAGPRLLEHVVDTVCDLSGDRHHALRLLRATKNRYGPVGEVGCFEMTGSGLRGVADAGRLFVGEAPEGTTGIATTVALEGHRPLACEVQALVTATQLGTPRRVASGLDAGRLNLLVAVLDERAAVRLGGHDVYAASVGGMRLGEPGADLAVALSIASSRTGRPVARDLVVLGEVGLSGEVRLVAQTERRLAQAARLGFTRALLPGAYDGKGFGLQLHRVRDLAAALDAGVGRPP